MNIEDMKQLILSLKQFKVEELSCSEDNRDVNRVVKMIDNTIDDKEG